MESTKTILIIGATGFIGSKLVNHFLSEGFLVIGIGRKKNHQASRKYSYFPVDLPSEALCEILIANKIDVCFFSAGSSSVNYSFDSPLTDFRETVDVTAFVLNAILNYSKTTKFIFISSAAVYGFQEKLPISEAAKISPISPYGYHKYISEILCREYAILYGLKIKILRVFSAYGEGLRKQVIWEICKQAYEKKQVLLKGSGNETRDLLHISDIAIALNKLVDEPNWNAEIFNVASGKEVSIKKLCELILENFPFKVNYQFDGTIHQGNPNNWEADVSKLNAINFIPKVSIESGIKNYVEWYQGNI